MHLRGVGGSCPPFARESFLPFPFPEGHLRSHGEADVSPRQGIIALLHARISLPILYFSKRTIKQLCSKLINDKLVKASPHCSIYFSISPS